MGFKNNSSFVHLHNHSSYSRFDGRNQIEEWVLHARKMGFKSLALTDHGNVGGIIKFYQACKRKKDKKDREIPYDPIKPILGEEFYLSRFHKEKNTDGSKGNRHLLLLAKNWEGYQNLCTLSQSSWTQGQYISPRIDLELLAKHSKGLICSSACLSSVVNNNLLKGRYDAAKQAATILKDIFNEDFFLEVMYHGMDAQGAIIPDVIKLGAELDIPIIATNDCHYCHKSQARSQEVLMAMSTHRCVKDPKRYHYSYDELYLKSAEEMAVVFGSHPEFLLNTAFVAERVEDFIKKETMRLPVFDTATGRNHLKGLTGTEYLNVGSDILKEIINGDIGKSVEAISKTSTDESFEDAYAFMGEVVEKGMRDLGWSQSKDHLEVLKKEMADLRVAWESNRMDFATYFLIVWDYIDYANRNGIMTGCGRGSGYASVILRALGITYGPDPIRYGLLWERFLAFSNSWFILDKDLGIGEEQEMAAVEFETDEDELDDARDVEDDSGGVDRY